MAKPQGERLKAHEAHEMYELCKQWHRIPHVI